MAAEVLHYFIRISSRLFPSPEQTASVLFEILPGVTQVEILGDHFGTYRFIVPTTIATSRDVEKKLHAAGIASEVQAMPPSDPNLPPSDDDRSNTPDD